MKEQNLEFPMCQLLRKYWIGVLLHQQMKIWVAALVEFNMVPHWSFFVSDMYNLDETEANSFTKTNYYSAGFSYLKNRTRIQLSYGRNRAGYVCSGGACRYMPAYTGLNLVITSSF